MCLSRKSYGLCDRSPPFFYVVQHLNKTSFILPQCLRHKFGLHCGGQPNLHLFGYSFWDQVDLGKSRRAKAVIPATCGRPSPGEQNCEGFPAAAESFSQECPARLLNVSAAWNAWLMKGDGFLGSRQTPRLCKSNWCALPGSSISAAWALCHLSFVSLGLCATWVQLGPFVVLVGRLSLPLGLQAICAWFGQLVVSVGRA